jgi:bacillithiol biosynthesis cysteine-adding enzyme BshC
LTPDCLPFAELPHTSTLFLDYIHHFDKVRDYFAHPPLTRDWMSAIARALPYDAERRAGVADILERQNRAWGASPETLENIRRFRSGASVIVTGQQVTLFGGPLFSMFKALSAIKLAAEATQSGVECVPVFWLATEDHDLEEVNHTTVLGADGSLRRVSVSTEGPEHASVGGLKLGKDVAAAITEAAVALGDSEALDFLRASYQHGETLGNAFARLFSRIFQHSGVILLDASDAELHGVAASVYRAAIRGAADLDEQLLERTKRLEAADYHAQVKVTAATTLLFGRQNGARLPIRRVNGDFVFGDQRLSPAALEQRIAASPADFSPNVLLRPVVQDHLLPTLAYVGGPAEVAYFAQVEVVYRELLGRVTPILPRFSATLIEPHIQRLMKRYELSLPDVFHGPEKLRELLASRHLPSRLDDTFVIGSRGLEDWLTHITTQLSALDPTLTAAAHKAGAKMRYQLQRLRGRAARAELRRHAELERQADTISTALFPDRQPQERVAAGVSFVARHGTRLLLRLYDAMNTACTGHQIIPI